MNGCYVAQHNSFFNMFIFGVTCDCLIFSLCQPYLIKFNCLFLAIFCINYDYNNSQSSVVVTGVPTKAYRLPTEWIQPNTTVVNVASFKNVDEEKLLQIPGVVYVPMVGKVTVAMLERNLMRLYDNFHNPAIIHNNATASTIMQEVKEEVETMKQSLWKLQLYTAVAVTMLLAAQLIKK